MSASKLSINPERLWDRIMEMAKPGDLAVGANVLLHAIMNRAMIIQNFNH